MIVANSLHLAILVVEEAEIEKIEDEVLVLVPLLQSTR